jgi:AbiV family abortive infection protein
MVLQEGKITLKELYTKTMVESIKNSGMWLKEAKMLSKKGSKAHSQALLIFSIEELGKAILCWYAIVGLIPFNHPVIDYRAGKGMKLKGVFRNHPLKFSTAMGLEFGLRYPDSFPEADGKIEDPFTKAPAPLIEVLGKIGSFGAWARTRWMYVDIDVEDEQPKVHSPLENDPIGVEEGIRDFERTLNQFKKLVRIRPLPHDLVDWIHFAREELKEEDEDFPDNPEWSDIESESN